MPGQQLFELNASPGTYANFELIDSLKWGIIQNLSQIAQIPVNSTLYVTPVS
jgi:hypothetical protein